MSQLPGPWSEILEDWVTTNDEPINNRQAKVMKLGDKGLTISYKAMGPNKRDVSETDLYLLSKCQKSRTSCHTCWGCLNLKKIKFFSRFSELNNLEPLTEKLLIKKLFRGAIEKLVYRVDFLEKRLRRSEELLYYVISGNNNAKGKFTSARWRNDWKMNFSLSW